LSFIRRKLAGVWHELEAAPANKTVVNGGTYTIMYTVETTTPPRN